MFLILIFILIKIDYFKIVVFIEFLFVFNLLIFFLFKIIENIIFFIIFFVGEGVMLFCFFLLFYKYLLILDKTIY